MRPAARRIYWFCTRCGGRLKTTIRRATRSLAGVRAARNVVRWLTRDHGLRCILYHEIADAPSEFTAGLSVTTSPQVLAEHLERLAQDYDFVSIDSLRDGSPATPSKRPKLLVTFDDAYASVANVAADICEEAGVPSVFFVNGAFVDNASLAFDNLVAWTVNTDGMAPLAAVTGRSFRDLAEFFGPYLSSITLETRARIYDELAERLPQPPQEMAAAAALYVTSPALASLRARGMVVGNHTWSHVYCRHLDKDSVETEIAANGRFLEAVVGHSVDTFSYPYGSKLDATEPATSALVGLGYRTGFLVESRSNRGNPDAMRLYRVSVGAVPAADLFTDLEVLPVMRRARDRLRST